MAWMSVCFEWCVLSESLRRADPLSRGFVPNVCICHWVWPNATFSLYTYLHLEWTGRKRSWLRNNK